MKLLFCTECSDLVALNMAYRSCQCAKSHGRYLEDQYSCEIGGSGVVLGLGNPVFIEAMIRWLKDDGADKQIPLDCFIIHKSYHRIHPMHDSVHYERADDER